MTIPTQTDVLVVGAGPTGLMLAAQLARRGVRPLVIDRHAGPSVQTKALGVQARTLEIYAQLGIAERAVEMGTRATGANMWVGARRAARLPLGDIGRGHSRYPYMLILGQDDNERLLGDVVRGLGVEVHWQTELVELQQGADHASATVTQSDGSQVTVRASWIAGCDGARSAVRELNGIAFVGAPYEHVFFVADTRLAGPMVPGELNVYLQRRGFHLLFPMRGADHWRVVGILPPELRGRDDVEFDAVLPLLRAEVGQGLDLVSCGWFSTYRIHHRRAERFRDGHCFLLGDAAHIHSPVGAQGMNTGLQDAYNLAWKLALVVTGRAAPGLLDSYAAEREPVATGLLQTTDRFFSIAVSDRWLAGMFRRRVFSKVLGVAMHVERARQLAFRTISQIGISYPRSRLSHAVAAVPDGAPGPGDRFPWLQLRFGGSRDPEDLFARLDDRRWNLLLFGQSPPPAATPGLDGIVVHEVADLSANAPELRRARIPTPSFYLLRPDCHVGLAGAGLDPAALAAYLAERVEIAAPQDR
jgi:2-polyprenyl-6-methoxyphenol hydroxylase-like FAD-dependent oxidoreductase